MRTQKSRIARLVRFGVSQASKPVPLFFGDGRTIAHFFGLMMVSGVECRRVHIAGCTRRRRTAHVPAAC